MSLHNVCNAQQNVVFMKSKYGILAITRQFGLAKHAFVVMIVAHIHHAFYVCIFVIFVFEFIPGKTCVTLRTLLIGCGEP